VNQVLADTIHVPADAPTIQIAIAKAQPFDTIIVAQRTYFEAISFGGKVIVVQSENPADADTVANTIIDAGGLGHVVTFSGGEDQVNTILDGFTVTGGTTGIRGNGTLALIRRCVIRDNSGSGIFQANGVIEDCQVLDNGGNGIEDCDGEIRQCAIRNNANGLLDCDGNISDSAVERNRSHGIFNGRVDVVRCFVGFNAGTGVFSQSGASSSTRGTPERCLRKPTHKFC